MIGAGDAALRTARPARSTRDSPWWLFQGDARGRDDERDRKGKKELSGSSARKGAQKSTFFFDVAADLKLCAAGNDPQICCLMERWSFCSWILGPYVIAMRVLRVRRDVMNHTLLFLLHAASGYRRKRK